MRVLKEGDNVLFSVILVISEVHSKDICGKFDEIDVHWVVWGEGYWGWETSWSSPDKISVVVFGVPWEFRDCVFDIIIGFELRRKRFRKLA